MNLAGVRRLAGHWHRGDVDDRGEPYVAHLDRVAVIVRDCGGGETVQMAAYLLGVSSKDVSWCDLLGMGVPPPVFRLVQAVTSQPLEPVDQRWTRLRGNRWAALLYAADLADDCRPPRPVSGARISWPAWVRQYAQARELAGDQRLPPVPVLDDPLGPPALSPGGWEAFHRLLAEAGAERYGSPRWGRLHAALFGAVRDPSLLEDLWPLTTDPRPWVRALALYGLASAGAAAQMAIEAALDDPEPVVVAAAVAALSDDALRRRATRLIELLGRAESRWRAVRRHCALRLRALDDPAARAAIGRGITDSDGTVSQTGGPRARRERRSGRRT